MPSDIIVIERELLKSEAFRSLSGNAKNVYFDFRMKCRIKKTKSRPGRKPERDILNNGEIEYSYSEAEKKAIPRTSFMRALDELTGKGLIDVAHAGSGGKKGDKSLYAISERWRAWRTDEFIENPRRKDIRKGRGFRPGNVHWKKQKARKVIALGNV
jgi:DNA-binding PadR family transcriptional regulator